MTPSVSLIAERSFISTCSMSAVLSSDLLVGLRPLSGPKLYHSVNSPIPHLVMCETVWENVKGFPFFCSVASCWVR